MDQSTAKAISPKLELTAEMTKVRHPLEYMAAPMRVAEDPYARMTENSLLLTNFPKGVKINEAFIMDLCLSHSESPAIIQQIYIKECLPGAKPDARNAAAYAIVDFESPSHVKSVKRGLWKHWIKDKLLKMRTLEDREQENFHARTLIITDFASHCTGEDVTSVLSSFGAITSVEAPTLDAYVQAQLAEKGLMNDHYAKERRAQKEQDVRFAR